SVSTVTGTKPKTIIKHGQVLQQQQQDKNGKQPQQKQQEPLNNINNSNNNNNNEKNEKPVLIALDIETSCDDTCAAIVTSDRRILAESLWTQHHLHEPMGGIVPKLAHHAHMQNLPRVLY